MNPANIIKKFNSIVLDLLEQTIDLIGTKFLFNFKLMTKMNAIAPIEKFTTTMLPYKKYINSRDINFFINQSKTFDHYDNINQNDMIDLRNIFLNIDSESQENIWDILDALIILAEERKSKSNNNVFICRN